MRMFRFDGLCKAAVLAGTLLVFVGLANAQRSAKLDDDDDKKSPTPPGPYITPTALANAVPAGIESWPHKLSGLRRRRGGKGRGQSRRLDPGDPDGGNELVVLS